MLREQLGAVGGDPKSIEVTEIESEAQAARADFPGSPTIRIDGRDVVDPEGPLPGRVLRGGSA